MARPPKIRIRGEDLVCPACGSRARLVDSARIYGRSYGMAWVCDKFPECDTYTGCHRGTAIPKGTLAGKETRELRKVAHYVFDKLWLSKALDRRQAYRELRDGLGVCDEVHIGEADKERCLEIIKWARKRLDELGEVGDAD